MPENVIFQYLSYCIAGQTDNRYTLQQHANKVKTSRCHGSGFGPQHEIRVHQLFGMTKGVRELMGRKHELIQLLFTNVTKKC